MSFHTPKDQAALVAAGVDPNSTEAREHATWCWCGTKTWHQAGGCERHYLTPAAARRAAA